MEGINKPSASVTLIQYGKHTLGKAEGLAQKYEGEIDRNSDEWYVYNPTPKELRAEAKWHFSETGRFYSNSSVNAASQAINQERDQAINQFLDGTMSGEELADTFQQLLTRFRDACNDAGYPIPVIGLGLHGEEAMVETFYSGFRRRVLELAVQQNDEEGKQYITGKIDTQRNWKYYNSDYYFKSEDALSAVTDGLNQYLEKRRSEVEGFTIDIPDYKAEGIDHCYNFNSAWSAYYQFGVCHSGEADQFMRDFDQVPPKNFEWFYQSGGDASVGARDFQFISPGGTSVSRENKPFDHTHCRSATTWAAYRDADGLRHFVETDFTYDHTENDRKAVSSLLKFTGNTKMDAAVNKFLNSLQVCSNGYYRRYGLIKGIDLRV